MTTKTSAKAKTVKTVVANDAEDRKGELRYVSDSLSDSWNNLLDQAVQALWLKDMRAAAEQYPNDFGKSGGA